LKSFNQRKQQFLRLFMLVKTIHVFVALSVAVFIPSAHAQNKVVVIPLLGDGFSSCSVGFCSAAEATLTCGSTSVQVPCLDHKTVFVTSTSFGGDLGGLVGADTKCNDLAVNAGLTGTYKAWLSDATGSPSTRFTKSTTPYVMTDNTIIALNYMDLIDGSLIAPIQIDETGSQVADNSVFTNTDQFGMAGRPAAGDSCNNWSVVGTQSVWVGTTVFTNADWTGQGFANRQCNPSTPLFCFEQ
jgi:hypothetical protein